LISLLKTIPLFDLSELDSLLFRFSFRMKQSLSAYIGQSQRRFFHLASMHFQILLVIGFSDFLNKKIKSNYMI